MMYLKRILIFFVVSIFTLFAQEYSEVGSLSVWDETGEIELRLIDTLDAIEAGNGVLMVTMPEGNIAAADFVDTTDMNASSVWINTVYGIRAWRKTFQNGLIIEFGGAMNDYGSHITETNEGNYLIAGITKSYGIGEADLLLSEFSPTGELRFCRTIGGLDNDGFTSDPQLGSFARKTIDGGYVIASHTLNFGADGADFFITKLNSEIDFEWSRIIGGDNNEEVRCLIETSDGDYILYGWTLSYIDGSKNSLLVRVNSDGDLIAAKVISGTHRDPGESIIEAPDGGFYLAGWTNSVLPDFTTSIFIIKLDSDLNIEWSKSYSGAGGYLAYSIDLMADGGLVLSGFRNNGLVLRTDALGNPEWCIKIDRTPNEERVYSIKAARDTAIIAAVMDLAGNNVHICKISDTPELQWAMDFESIETSWVYGFDITETDEIIFTGFMRNDSLEQQAVLAKMRLYDGANCYSDSSDIYLISRGVDVSDYDVEIEDIGDGLVPVYPIMRIYSPNVNLICE